MKTEKETNKAKRILTSETFCSLRNSKFYTQNILPFKTMKTWLCNFFNFKKQHLFIT